MLLQMEKFHSFLWLNSIPLYTYTTFSLSIHLLMNTGCFHILALVNSAAMNIGSTIFLMIASSNSTCFYNVKQEGVRLERWWRLVDEWKGGIVEGGLWVFFFLIFKKKFWHIVDLQCCVSFRCTAK